MNDPKQRFSGCGGASGNFPFIEEVQKGGHVFMVQGCSAEDIGEYRLKFYFTPRVSFEDAGEVLLFPVDDGQRHGFVRVISRNGDKAEVMVNAVNDQGDSKGPVFFSGHEGAAFHFNAKDLERGNPEKGQGKIERPETGDWRLKLKSTKDVKVLAYMRTMDGFLTGLNERLPRDAQGRLVAWTFNPGQNHSQVSSLRLVNTGADAESVSISGVDDQGASAGAVSLTLDAGEARTLSAQDLENGASGLTGRLGDGAGKWRLFIRAGESVVGMSLLESPTGHLTNLSSAGG